VIDGKWIERVVNTINKAQPEIVFLSGDIFDGNIGSIKNIDEIILQLKRINAPLGVYACLGNHDVDRMSITEGKTERIAGILKSAGVVLLWDEVYKVRENLYIAGRKDARPIGMSPGRLKPEELLAGLDGTIIVLDHQPVEFPLLEKAGADLVLSGHTHRGQIFPGSLITSPMYKKMGADDYGYWKGNTMQGVVTSGAGIWGPPLRVGTNSEAAVIDIGFVQF
jgi:predicted MPP superfamily phosphohydrolase